MVNVHMPYTFHDKLPSATELYAITGRSAQRKQVALKMANFDYTITMTTAF